MTLTFEYSLVYGLHAYSVYWLRVVVMEKSNFIKGIS